MHPYPSYTFLSPSLLYLIRRTLPCLFAFLSPLIIVVPQLHTKVAEISKQTEAWKKGSLEPSYNLCDFNGSIPAIQALTADSLTGKESAAIFGLPYSRRRLIMTSFVMWIKVGLPFNVTHGNHSFMSIIAYMSLIIIPPLLCSFFPFDRRNKYRRGNFNKAIKVNPCIACLASLLVHVPIRSSR